MSLRPRLLDRYADTCDRAFTYSSASRAHTDYCDYDDHRNYHPDAYGYGY